MQVWAIIIASFAVLVSVLSLVFNWRHSESLFRRTEYPAVAWYPPKLSKEGNNTAITVSICNHGSKDIISIFLRVYLCKGFQSKAWCRSDEIPRIPIGEDIVFHITRELEKDITERFGDLSYEKGWKYKGRTRGYKIIFKLLYLPLIADTTYHTRRAYYSLKPMIQSGSIISWELEHKPNWQGWFPWF